MKVPPPFPGAELPGRGAVCPCQGGRRRRHWAGQGSGAPPQGDPGGHWNHPTLQDDQDSKGDMDDKDDKDDQDNNEYKDKV